MKILGIETSCDETAAAIVENGTEILTNIVASSQDIHKKSGGIIPEIAAREQIKCVIPVINEALQLTSKKIKKEKSLINYPFEKFRENFDAIAVTIGPGLIGSLLVGVESAKTMALVLNKPIIPVNHIFAHIYANWLTSGPKPQFPLIALVVSGGHTELFLMKKHGNIKWLGGTQDDAAGEAFDKTARLLGLGYPGGPAIANEAAKYQNLNITAQKIIKLPRPMIDSKNFNFSFSGLKTAVLRQINQFKYMNQLNNSSIQLLAYEIQESISDVLVEKTIKAARQYQVKSILLGGGVAANERLNKKFHAAVKKIRLNINLHIPPPNLCTDNAAYIASFAYFNFKPISWNKIQATPDLEIEV